MCPAKGQQQFDVQATPAQLAGGRLFLPPLMTTAASITIRRP
jgi:hypothetical protein